MDLREPLRAIAPTLDAPVLRVLAGTSDPMTRPQITRLVGVASEAGVRKVLRRLADQGIVLEERVGSQYTYAANRDHLMWSAVEASIRVGERLAERVRAYVEAWPITPISVELFGSAATGRATGESDIDLMLYRPVLIGDEHATWEDQVANLRTAVERWTGNPCEILEFDPPALVEMVAEEEPVLRSPMQHISGMRLVAAVPSAALARALRESTRTGDAGGEATERRLSESVMTPELRRTLTELAKLSKPPLRAEIEKVIGRE